VLNIKLLNLLWILFERPSTRARNGEAGSICELPERLFAGVAESVVPDPLREFSTFRLPQRCDFVKSKS
jgi:hypothetical protein